MSFIPGALPLGDGGDGQDAAGAGGGISLPIGVTVQGAGAPGLPIRVSVGRVGSVSVGTSVSIVASAILSGASTVSDGAGTAAAWLPKVSIGGVDVSSAVIDDIEVDGEEGCARVASFTLALEGGAPVSLPAYVGKEVLIEIADGAGNNRMRLFHGKLNLPDIDIRSRTIRCSCTDDLQNRVAAATRDYLGGVIGGRWSAAVFDKGASSWRFAQDTLTTVPACLDISVWGQLRLTPWAPRLLADLSFDENAVLDGSVAVAYAERAALINEVSIDFGYRFPRIKSEGYEIDFSYIPNGFSAWVNAGNGFLFRSAVVTAIEQAGGSIVSIAYVALPTMAQVVGGGFWIPNPATDPLMCLGFHAVVSFDYTQDVDEAHAIRVYSAESIDAVGLIADRISGALAGVALDNSAAETNILLYKNEISKIPPLTAPSVVAGKTNAAAITLTAETGRPAAEAAMETLVDVAKVRIAASHRGTRVSAAVPLNPLIDTDKTVSLAAQGVSCKGKCASFKHRMNADTGEAISEFSLAITSLSGLGLAVAGDATVASTGTPDGVTSTLAPPVCVYNGLATQDQSFTITFPAVVENQRNAAEVSYSAEIQAPLAEDDLTIVL